MSKEIDMMMMCGPIPLSNLREDTFLYWKKSIYIEADAAYTVRHHGAQTEINEMCVRESRLDCG